MDSETLPLIIGYHARKTGVKTYEEAYRRAAQMVVEELPNVIPCVALFISGPRNTRLNINPRTADALGSRPKLPLRGEPTGELLFHASYLDLPWATSEMSYGALSAPSAPQLPGTLSVPSSPMSYDVPNASSSSQSANAGAEDAVFARIDAMIEVCAQSRADVVIHGGSHIFDSTFTHPILARMSRSLDKVWQKMHPPRMPRIFIETMAHDGRFASPNALNTIFDDQSVLWHEPGHEERGNIGLCIDTAHIWAAGANIASREDCAEWLQAIRTDIPVAMHLNDSKEVIGTHTDEHTTLGHGEIWSLSDGYVAALNWCRERHAPVILERNDVPEQEARADLATIRLKLF